MVVIINTSSLDVLQKCRCVAVFSYSRKIFVFRRKHHQFKYGKLSSWNIMINTITKFHLGFHSHLSDRLNHIFFTQNVVFQTSPMSSTQIEECKNEEFWIIWKWKGPVKMSTTNLYENSAVRHLWRFYLHVYRWVY